jgi:hypothetical protein
MAAGFPSLPSSAFNPFRYTIEPFELPEPIKEEEQVPEQPDNNFSLAQNIDFLWFLEMQKQMSVTSQSLPIEREIEQIKSHLNLTRNISLLAVLEKQKRTLELESQIQSLQNSISSRITVLTPVMPEEEEPKINVSSADVIKRQILEIPKSDEPASTSIIQVQSPKSSSIDELSLPETPSSEEEDPAPKLSRKRNIEELANDDRFVEKSKRLFSNVNVPLTKEQAKRLNECYSKRVNKSAKRVQNKKGTSGRYKDHNRRLEVAQMVYEQRRIIAQQKAEIERLKKRRQPS